MLRAVRWTIIRASFIQAAGILLLVAATSPFLLFAYISEPNGVIALVLSLALFCGVVTAFFAMIKGLISAYRYGNKSEEFIRRFYAALVEAGIIREN